MAITLQQFVSQLNESGVISAEELSTFQESQSPPVESAEDLGKLLVKHKKVTKLQAQMVYQGKGERLLLGNYIVLDKIGAGGMGDVYLAEHRRMKRQVALKTLPAAMTKDSQAIGRFHREVQAAAKLTHPNIVTAYDADEANGVHYFVMEHVDGIDLSAVVKKQGVLKVDVAVDYILQAAKGLEFAHNKGVIHRDIKPANMLLDNDGTIKILDMGLARIEDEAHEIPATQLTQDGSVMGTVDYMAPEQAKDTHTADARSDIYSLGCSLYYLLTGESVYSGSTMVNRIMAHQNDPIPSLADKHIHIPVDIDAVYQKMIAKRPEDRFQSMQEVIDAFENCIRMKSSPTVSEEPSDPELHKFLQSQRVASSPTVVMSADAMTAEKPLTDSQNETLTSGFLDNTLGGTVFKPLQKRMQSLGKRGWIAVGAVLASLILLAGIVLKVDTDAGTIILEIDQPELAGAVVSVDDQKKITIKTGEGTEPIEVVADEKTHTLQVTKGGFETFTKQFTVKAGGKEQIKVRLVPLKMAEKKVPSAGTPAKSHYALRFQNDTDLVTLPLKHETAGDLTVEAWVTIDEDSIPPLVYISNGTSLTGFHLSNATIGKNAMQWSAGVANKDNPQLRLLQSRSKVELGKRTNIAVTYKGNVAQIYVNGHKKGELNSQGSEIHTDQFITIGNRFANNRYFKGSIDEVRFSNIARYSKDFTPENHFETDKNTLALYHFDKGSGDVLKDSSGNGHDGKIVGAKWVKVDNELQGSMVPLGVAEKKVPSAGTPAKSHYALRFQNDSDRVILPLKHETAGDLTVEAWVTIDENSNGPLRIIANGSSLTCFGIGYSKAEGKEKEWSTCVSNNGQFQVLQTDSKVEFGKRTNIAVTFKGDVAQIYVNGHKKGEMNFNGSNIHTDEFITIGNRYKGPPIKGSTDEVRFSNIARYTEDFTPTDHFENDKNTLALYHFDEGSGDVLKDSSGNGHDGKIVGAKWVKVDDDLQGSMIPLAVAEKKMPSAGTSAKSHYALRFQNNSDHVTLPLKHEKAGDLTVEAWATFDENPNGTINYIMNEGFRIGLLQDNGKGPQWFTSIANDGKYQVLPSNSKAELGKRTNIAVTYKENVAQIFVNGHKKGELNFKGLNIQTNRSIIIGTLYPRLSYFNGSIDEVRFSNIARYSKDFTPENHFETDEHTLALYHFDEGSGDVLKDSSGNGHHGKIVGAKWVQADDELKVVKPSTTSEKSMTDREVAEWVIGMGGKAHISGKLVTRIEELPTGPLIITAVHLDNTSVKDEDLKRLAGLKMLLNVNLADTLISDTGIQYLKDIELEYLVLTKTKITDQGVDYLKDMKSLSVLKINSRSDESITNSSLKSLKNLKQLTILNVISPQIDDIGIEHLAGLTNLEMLYLYRTQITDNGLKYLQGMSNLHLLELANTGITDAGLEQLHGLKKLENLNLKKTKVTPEGIAELQKALPNCKIESDFEAVPPKTENHALQFNGESSFVEIKSLTGETYLKQKSDQFTIEFWMNPDLDNSSNPVNYCVASFPFSVSLNGNNVNTAIHAGDGKNVIAYGSGSHTQLTDGRSYHIALLFSDGVQEIYINGKKQKALLYKSQKGSTSETTEKITLSTDATRIKQPTGIGAGNDPSAKLNYRRFFKGIIDEVRISNIARYEKDFTPAKRFETDEHTMALYHFDKGSGNILKDASGNGHDGKIVGARWVKLGDELKVVKSATTGDSPMTDREIAEWIIGMGGAIGINGDTLYSKIEDLPAEPVKFFMVKLKTANFEDLDLKRLVKLKTLGSLKLDSASISNAGLQYLSGIQKLITLNLLNTKITDEGLVHLSNHKNLQYLVLSNTTITGEGLGHLKGLSKLINLMMDHTAITNSGMQAIGDLKQLNVLNIAFNPLIDDSGLSHLEGLVKLERLYAHNLPQITNEGLKHLQGMKQLDTLTLSNTGITNAGLEQLAKHERLSELGISNCKITDSGLEHLKDLKNLQDLRLDLTPISDAGLKHLHGLEKLAYLNLRDTKVTPQGIADLQKALPNCKILSDFGTKPPATKAP